ncbi:hypothetical protein DITRI_Ditri17bG0105000 [Diplodiscus trichospermus]
MKFGVEHAEKIAQVSVLVVKDATSFYTDNVLLSSHQKQKSIIPFIRHTLSPLPWDLDQCRACDERSDSMAVTRTFPSFVTKHETEFTVTFVIGLSATASLDACSIFPSLFISNVQSGVDCRAIPKDEENSALEATIAEINNEIADLSAKEKPLEAEIERLQGELKPIKQRLERLKKIRFRYSGQLNLNRNESF